VFPCFLPRRCSHRRRAPGEPPWQCWCPIGEGKSFPGSRRLRLWGQGAARASPRCWPRRSVARRGGARRRAPSSRTGIQLRWAMARPYHGECPGDASEVAGRLLLAGCGGSARRSSGRVRCSWPGCYGRLSTTRSMWLTSRSHGDPLRLCLGPAQRPDAPVVAAPWRRRHERGVRVLGYGVHGARRGLSSERLTVGVVDDRIAVP